VGWAWPATPTAIERECDKYSNVTVGRNESVPTTGEPQFNGVKDSLVREDEHESHRASLAKKP